MNSVHVTQIPPSFSETQHFREWWLLLIVVLAALVGDGVMITGLYVQLVLGRPWGDNPVPDAALVAFAIFIFLVTTGTLVAILSMNLKTRLLAEGIHLRLFPLADRLIRWEEIAEAHARDYRPIREFGGWGVRCNMRGDRCYNASGNQGVQLVLNDGRRVMIGSQRPWDLERAIHAALANR